MPQLTIEDTKKTCSYLIYYFHWNATYSQPAVITSRSDREMSRAAGQQEICINFKMKKCWSHFNYLNFILCLNGDFTCTLQLTSERICESQSSSFRMHCSASTSGHCVLWLQLLLWKPFFCSAFSTVGSSQNPCFFFFFLLKQGHKGGRGIKRGGQRWSQTQVFAPNVALSHRPDHLLPWATTYQISLGKTASDIFSAQSDAFKISLSQKVWNVSQWPLCHRGWSWQEVCGFLLLVWTYFHYFISLGIAFINIYFLFFPIPSSKWKNFSSLSYLSYTFIFCLAFCFSLQFLFCPLCSKFNY